MADFYTAVEDEQKYDDVCDIRKKANEIQLFLNDYIQKQKIVIRKKISIIEKGKENALYTSTSSWGKIHERGIRLEIIH